MPSKEAKKMRGIFERPKDSGIWWICYFDQFGRKHRECVGMKSAASKVYQQRKTEIRQGKFEPQDIRRKHQNTTVAEIIEDYLKASEANGRKSLGDLNQRAGWWKDRFGLRAAKSIIKDDIESARLEFAQGRFPRCHEKEKQEGMPPRSVATVNRYLATFKSAFLMALANEKVDKNPFLKIKLQKENNTRVRFLSENEEERLLKAIPPHWHAPVLVAIHTGLRFGEQMHLKWEDVDFKQRLLTVRESKSGSARHIPLNQIALSALQSIPRRLTCSWVFYTEGGERREQLARQWKPWLKVAEIDNFHWHDLRHPFASRLVMAGVDLYAVKELLGHHSIEMTQRYAHLSPGHLKQAVEMLVSSKQVTPKLTPDHISA